MTLHLLLIIFALIASSACGFFFIPGILSFCKEKGLYDIPNPRKIHNINNVPRLGGISFVPSMLVAFLIALMVFDHMMGKNHLIISLWTCSFVVSILLIYGIGIIDDLIGLNAPIKFAVQILAAGLIPFSGLYINNLYGLCGIEEIPFWIGCPLTIFVMVFITNAINLIDGIDGLCSGLSFLALGGFLISFLREGMYLYCILIAGVMGVLIPYFYFNVFGDASKNRKIFMGDSGSLSLGFMLAFLFVKYAMNNPLVMPFRMSGLLLPYTLLIVPVFDVARMIIVRTLHHKPIFSADKNHIHHKLLRAGLNQHQALIVILVLALCFIVLNISLFFFTDITLIIAIDVVCYILFHQVLNQRLKAQGQDVFSMNPKEIRKEK